MKNFICSFVVSFSVVVAAAGCTATQRAAGRVDKYAHSAFPTKDFIKADRDTFLSLIKSIETEYSDDSKSNQRWYNSLSAAGIVIGVGGAMYAVYSSSDENNRKIAQSTSIISGGITGLLVLFHFEGKATNHEDGAKYFRHKSDEFRTKWSDLSLPNSQESFDEFVKEKNDIIANDPCK